MNKRIASLVLVSAMGVGTVSGLALTPAFAAAGDKGVGGFTAALKGLVSDGTISQSQADKVATALEKARPRGGPGRVRHHLLHDAAKLLGMTVEQLRTAMGTTKSLAQVAEAKGISRATLLDSLAAVIEKHLAAEVKAGHLTQAQADARKAEIRSKLSQAVDRVGLPPRRDHGGPPLADAPTRGGAEQSSSTT